MLRLIVITIRRFRHLILYGTIGACALAVELIIFYFLSEVNNQAIALNNAVAMGTGFFMSFSLNSFFNFQVSDKLFNRLVRYGIITTAGYLLSTSLILGLVEFVHLAPFYAKLVSLPLFFLFQYTLNSRFTFNKTPVSEETSD